MNDYEQYAALAKAMRENLCERLWLTSRWARNGDGYGVNVGVTPRDARVLDRLFYTPLLKSFEEFDALLSS